MPRPSKGPYLYHDKQRGLLYIRDGQLKRGNSFNEDDRASAERALAEYILKKHDPQRALNKDHPNKTKIADVLSLEMKRIAATAMPDHRKKELITVCENMGDWFGGREIGDLDGELQERYAAERKRYVMKKIDGKRIVVRTDEPAPIAAYRDLKMLAAAINRFFKKKVGGVWTRFSPVLPDAPKARERWLTRDEAAKAIMTAWRKRRDSGIPGKPGRHTSRHLARYILVGLYTGSRDGDICKLHVGAASIQLHRRQQRRKVGDHQPDARRSCRTRLHQHFGRHGDASGNGISRRLRIAVDRRCASPDSSVAVKMPPTRWSRHCASAGSIAMHSWRGRRPAEDEEAHQARAGISGIGGSVATSLTGMQLQNRLRSP